MGRGRTDLWLISVGDSRQEIHFCAMYRPGEVSGSAALLASWGGLSASAVPPILQLDDPVAGGGAGDQVELVGLGDVVEQPGALVRNVGVQAQAELVDQVEPHERPPEADAAPGHDVAVAALPEFVDLLCGVASGDGGAGPVGRRQGPGEDDLAPGVQDAGPRVVGGRCQGPGHAL